MLPCLYFDRAALNIDPCSCPTGNEAKPHVNHLYYDVKRWCNGEVNCYGPNMGPNVSIYIMPVAVYNKCLEILPRVGNRCYEV